MSFYFNYGNALELLNSHLGNDADALIRIEQDLIWNDWDCLGNSARSGARCSNSIGKSKGAPKQVKLFLQQLQDHNAREHPGFCKAIFTDLSKLAFCGHHKGTVLNLAKEIDALRPVEEKEIEERQKQYIKLEKKCDQQRSQLEDIRSESKVAEAKLASNREEQASQESDMAKVQEELQVARHDLRKAKQDLGELQANLKTAKKQLEKAQKAIADEEALRESVEEGLRNELGHGVADGLRDELAEDVFKELREELESSVREQLEEDLQEGVREDLREDLYGEVRDELKEELESEVREEAKKDVGETAETDLKNILTEQLRQQLRTDLELSIKKQLKEDLKAEVKEEWRREWRREVKEDLAEVLRQHFGGLSTSARSSLSPPSQDSSGDTNQAEQALEPPVGATAQPSTVLERSDTWTRQANGRLTRSEETASDLQDIHFVPYSRDNPTIPSLVERLLSAANKIIDIKAKREVADSPDMPDAVEGFIYAYHRKGFSKYVKIGFTTKNVDVYLAREQGRCGFEIEGEPYKSKLVIHPRKVERMIHVELIRWRHKLKKCNCGASESHGEYFKIPFASAVEAIDRWTGCDLAQFYTGRAVDQRWIWSLNDSGRAGLRKFCEGIKEILPQNPVDSLRTAAAIAVNVLTNDSNTSQESTVEEDEANSREASPPINIPGSFEPDTPPTTPRHACSSSSSSPSFVWSTSNSDTTPDTSASFAFDCPPTPGDPAAATEFRTPMPRRPGPNPLPTPPDSAENLGQGMGQGHASDCIDVPGGFGSEPESPSAQRAERRRRRGMYAA